MEIVWHPNDDGLAAFIHEYLDSFCSWDLLVFLAHNPDSVDTARGLAARVGRPIKEIGPCLERLAQKGLLESAVAFDDKVYRLAAGSEQLAVLRRFANQQGEAAVRTAAVRRIKADQQDLVKP